MKNKTKKIIKTVAIVGAVGLLAPVIFIGGAELLRKTVMFKYEFATNYIDAITYALPDCCEDAMHMIKSGFGGKKK